VEPEVLKQNGACASRHHQNDQQRVKLIATEVALEMINRGLREDLMLIRKLPEMVQTPLEQPSPRDAVVVVEENVGRKALVIGTGYIVSGIRFKSSNFTQQL
jgi:hypothetical protein